MEAVDFDRRHKVFHVKERKKKKEGKRKKKKEGKRKKKKEGKRKKKKEGKRKKEKQLRGMTVKGEKDGF